MRSVKIMTVCFMAVWGVLALCGPAWAVEGMVSYWKFDEGSGTTAFDYFDDNHGTIYGATWTTGIVNGALSFDGIDDYISIPHDASQVGMSEITLEAWVKPSVAGANQNILLKGNYGYGLFIRYNKLGYWGRSIQNYCPVFGTVNAGEWSHVAVSVKKGVVVIFYINGVEVGRSTSSSHTTINNGDNQNLIIGRQGTRCICNYMRGLIDEVAIYNRALTAEEIQVHYEYGLRGHGYLDPETMVGLAIAEKVEALERINVALEREWLAYAALEELLESGDYGDLNKADIIRAKHRIHSAIQLQEQSKNLLQISIERLEDSLWLLGYEMEP